MPKHLLIAVGLLLFANFVNTSLTVNAQGIDPPCPFKEVFTLGEFYVYTRCECDELNDCEEYEISGATYIYSTAAAVGCSPTKSATGKCVCNTNKIPDIDNGSNSAPIGYLRKPLLKDAMIKIAKNDSGETVGFVNTDDHIVCVRDGVATRYFRCLTVVKYSKNFEKNFESSFAFEYSENPGKYISHNADGTWKYQVDENIPEAELANHYTLQMNGRNFTVLARSPVRDNAIAAR